MRRISAALSILALALLTLAPLGSAPVGFSHFMPLRVDSAQISANGADVTDFPLAVSVTNDALKTVANGGNVRSSSGYDICFYSDQARTTALHALLVAYDGSAGTVQARVKHSFPHATDTVFWMYWGDAGITSGATCQDGAVWDSTYVAVYQRPGLDNDLSASHNNPDANSGTDAAGLFGRATAYNGTTQYSGIPTATSLEPANWTLEMWVMSPIAWSTNGCHIMDKDPRTSAPYIAWDLSVGTGGKPAVEGGSGGSTYTILADYVPEQDVWVHVAGKFDGTTYSIWTDGRLNNYSNNAFLRLTIGI